MNLPCGLFALLVGLSGVGTSRTIAAGEVPVLRESNGNISLYVESSRPIAEAIEALVERYETVITYEDPRYTYSGDLEDVTDLVAGPSTTSGRNQMRVLVPRRTALKVESKGTDVQKVLEDVIQAGAAQNAVGQFRIIRSGEVLHVVPTAVRGLDGVQRTQKSVLDTRISFRATPRTADELLEVIRDETSENARVRIRSGAFGLDGGVSTGQGPPQYVLGAENELARDVLQKALQLIAKDRGSLSWLLFYGDLATDDAYVLNLIKVSDAPREVPRSREATEKQRVGNTGGNPASVGR